MANDDVLLSNFCDEFGQLNPLALYEDGKIPELDKKDDEIKDFCEKICKTLSFSVLGYGVVEDLAIDVFEDHHLDPHRKAQKFGFASFEEFLRSDHMKGYIDIEEGRGVVTFHCPMARSKKSNTEIHDAQVESAQSFLDSLDNSGRNSRLRSRLYDNGCPNLTELLMERHKKRLGLPVPPRPRKEIATLPTAGRPRRPPRVLQNSTRALPGNGCEPTTSADTGQGTSTSEQNGSASRNGMTAGRMKQATNLRMCKQSQVH